MIFICQIAEFIDRVRDAQFKHISQKNIMFTMGDDFTYEVCQICSIGLVTSCQIFKFSIGS